MGNKYRMTVMIAHTLSPPNFGSMKAQACLLSRHFQTSSNELAGIYCWKQNTMTATAEFPTELPCTSAWLVWNYHVLAEKTCNVLKSLPTCKISRKNPNPTQWNISHYQIMIRHCNMEHLKWRLKNFQAHNLFGCSFYQVSECWFYNLII